MACACVVEIFVAVGHRYTEFNNRGPGFTVEKFGVYSSPERFNPHTLIQIGRSTDSINSAHGVRVSSIPWRNHC